MCTVIEPDVLAANQTVLNSCRDKVRCFQVPDTPYSVSRFQLPTVLRSDALTEERQTPSPFPQPDYERRVGSLGYLFDQARELGFDERSARPALPTGGPARLNEQAG